MEKINAQAHISADVIRGAMAMEQAAAHGRFHVECFDRDGFPKWIEDFDNVVCTIGKNVMLDAALAGAAYTVTGPFLGLISSVSFTATAAGDTMLSHTGWTEAGGANAPTYTAPRKTAVWATATAGSKALSAALSFAITGTGTVKGCFMVYGSGALATIDNTGGSLLSAGTFSADKIVANGDTLNVSYSLAL